MYELASWMPSLTNLNFLVTCWTYFPTIDLKRTGFWMFIFKAKTRKVCFLNCVQYCDKRCIAGLIAKNKCTLFHCHSALIAPDIDVSWTMNHTLEVGTAPILRYLSHWHLLNVTAEAVGPDRVWDSCEVVQPLYQVDLARLQWVQYRAVVAVWQVPSTLRSPGQWYLGRPAVVASAGRRQLRLFPPLSGPLACLCPAAQLQWRSLPQPQRPRRLYQQGSPWRLGPQATGRPSGGARGEECLLLFNLARGQVAVRHCHGCTLLPAGRDLARGGRHSQSRRRRLSAARHGQSAGQRCIALEVRRLPRSLGAALSALHRPRCRCRPDLRLWSSSPIAAAVGPWPTHSLGLVGGS